MESLDWIGRSIRVNGRSLSNRRFADDVVLFLRPYVYLGSMDLENDLKEELSGRQKAAWAAFRRVKEAADQLGPKAPSPPIRFNRSLCVLSRSRLA
ncbi:unnamed protein product [Strongylus vulgaris]|uniref:Uncharacterized protein n=1 Tax=Strongylus vulgaris TaxID=40348 RepID=A0A3P7JTY7_STRVU|nr:unnamed protein product [Strongylus vulgaris]